MAKKKKHQEDAINQGFSFGEQTKIGDGATFYNYAGAQNVIVNHFGDKNTTKKSQPSAESEDPVQEALRKQSVKEAVLQYVMKTMDFVADQWSDKYMLFWERLFLVPDFEARIYNPGRQQNTVFNRSLVGNVMGFLCSRGVYLKKVTNKSLTKALEGDSDASIRQAMGKLPGSQQIEDFMKNAISNPEELGDETPPT